MDASKICMSLLFWLSMVVFFIVLIESNPEKLLHSFWYRPKNYDECFVMSIFDNLQKFRIILDYYENKRLQNCSLLEG